tara:strand:+ start:1620 stop:1799 length:180 start_codon:yes stop_codon:yes gene_type:complete
VFIRPNIEAAIDTVQNLPFLQGIECFPKKIILVARGSTKSKLVGLVDRHNPVSIKTAVQ